MSNWDLTGMKVWGMYLNTFPVSGTVKSSRVKYGGTVQHTVTLDEPLTVFDGRVYDRGTDVLVKHSEVVRVKD